MRIAVWLKNILPLSLSLYANEILKQFDSFGIEYKVFDDFAKIEGEIYDIIWHPTLSGLWFPEYEFYLRRDNIVATCHGVRPFILNEDLDDDQRAYNSVNKSAVRIEWAKFQWRISKVIAVSEVAKREITNVYELPEDMIDVIYHGVNKEVFYPRNNAKNPPYRYLLCVSQYQYVKNIDRLVESFVKANLDEETKLYLHLPDYEGKIEVDNVVVRTERLNSSELGELYRNAFAFVFPTLHESFGLPVIEAMASGCPVITSKNTGTEEVSGGAAILVDPLNVDEISAAIKTIVTDKLVYGELVKKGLERAQQFDWSISAKLHLETFRKAAKL